MSKEQAPFGFECKMYYLTTGTRAAWSDPMENLGEIDEVRDAKLNMSVIEGDDTDRSTGYVLTDAGLFEASVDFQLRNDTSQTTYQAIRAAFTGRTTIAIAVLDGTYLEAASEGVWADWIVTKFERPEGLREKTHIDVTIKPARTSVAPEWVVVTS